MRHRDHFTQRIEPAARTRLEEAVLSGRRSLVEVYRHFGLERLITASAFRKWARELRGAAAGGVAAEPRPAEASRGQKLEELLASCLQALQEALESRTLKGIALTAAMRAIADLSRLAIDEAAEQRAGQKHDAWRSEWEAAQRKRQEAALTSAQQSARLSDEQVAAIRRQVLGL